MTKALYFVAFAYHRATGDRGSINDSILIVSFATCVQLMCISLLVISAAVYWEYIEFPMLPQGLPVVMGVSGIAVYFWLRKRCNTVMENVGEIAMTRREAATIVGAYALSTLVLIWASFVVFGHIRS